MGSRNMRESLPDSEQQLSVLDHQIRAFLVVTLQSLAMRGGDDLKLFASSSVHESLRAVCLSARNIGLRVEQVIVLLKRIRDELPDAKMLAHTADGERILNDIVA